MVFALLSGGKGGRRGGEDEGLGSQRSLSLLSLTPPFLLGPQRAQRAQGRGAVRSPLTELVAEATTMATTSAPSPAKAPPHAPR